MDNKFHFFYHGYLSNFYPAKFEENGITFHNTEQYMMYHKAVLFKDNEIINLLKLQSNPFEAKKLGRRVANFDNHIWDKHKKEIVKRGNILKFEQNPELAEKLKAITAETIVEASPFDAIWGIGYDESMGMQNLNDWGLNLLGIILTEIRNYMNPSMSKSIF